MDKLMLWFQEITGLSGEFQSMVFASVVTMAILITLRHIILKVVWRRIEDFSVRYICEPRQRRIAFHAIWEDILEQFAQCPDVDFAYPTQRFHNNITEGKDGTRPPSPA